jgi:hypothetical protein
MLYSVGQPAKGLAFVQRIQFAHTKAAAVPGEIISSISYECNPVAPRQFFHKITNHVDRAPEPRI